MRGFTLIETVVYIALLGILMSGALMASYQIIEAMAQTGDHATTQEEGNFVLRKFTSAMSGAASVTPTSGCVQTLHVTKYDGTTADIRYSGGVVQMSDNNGVNWWDITTSNVSVSSLQFCAVLTGTIKGISATLILDAKTFSATKYIRS